MSVVLSIEDVGPCLKELKIEVPAPAVEAETERVLRDLRKRVSVPGFRRGKVPPHVVRQRYGDDLEQEVVERLVPRYWRQAEAEAGIDALTAPELAGVDNPGNGEPLVFTARVETRPEIELGNVTDFDLPDPAVEVADDEVRAAVDELRRRQGSWEPVDRPAAQGDKVKAEVVEQEEGAEPRDPATAEVEIGDPRVWEELSIALTGLAAGQKGEFTRTAPPAEEGAEPGPPRTYRLEVSEVAERRLPELDDAFAAQVGPFESVAELEKALRRRIELEKGFERRQARERALLDQLRERHPLELPQGVVGEEIERLLREYASELASRGVDLERAGIDWRQLGEQVRPNAEARVHARLLLEAIAAEREITVSEAELEEALADIGRREKASPGAVRQALDRDGRLGRLRAQMQREKVIRHLLGDAPADGSVETPGGEADDAAVAAPDEQGS